MLHNVQMIVLGLFMIPKIKSVFQNVNQVHIWIEVLNLAINAILIVKIV